MLVMKRRAVHLIAIHLFVVAIACVIAASAADAQGRRSAKPDPTFRDCSSCPMMVKLPVGEFMMGSPETEPRREANEGPQRLVTFTQAFAIGKYEVSFSEWDTCVAKGGCRHKPSDDGKGRGRRPVVDVSWGDAVEFVSWLAKTTGKPYRLPTEAEWEYAARGITSATAQSQPFSVGQSISYRQANFDANFVYGAAGKIGIYRQATVDTGSLPRNPFGLHEMHGNVWEWVQDCYAPDYRAAPADGSAVTRPDCRLRILRGGAWNYYPWALRSAYRYATPADVRLNNAGLRVALTLPEAAPAPAASEGNTGR
ncbi:MAG: formylglycine-generating enzyme family protein [Hyphomicrobiaceae bacterium]|nr:formylglycine-generating enzyme family protein [Hyphomicrobiaceae bacterium]